MIYKLTLVILITAVIFLLIENKTNHSFPVFQEKNICKFALNNNKHKKALNGNKLLTNRLPEVYSYLEIC